MEAVEFNGWRKFEVWLGEDLVAITYAPRDFALQEAIRQVKEHELRGPVRVVEITPTMAVEVYATPIV